MVATYLRLLAWPTGQNLEWDLPVARSLGEASLGSGLALAALASGAAAAWWWSRRRAGATAAAVRVAAFGVAFFFLALLPTSSVVPLDDLLMEHRVYLASFGIFLAVAVVGERAARFEVPPWATASAVAAVLLSLALALHARNAVWETRFALAADSAAKSPRKARPHVNLGHALDERGDYEGALREYGLALAHSGGAPKNEALVLRNLSATLAHLGRWGEAEEALRRAASRSPDSAEVQENLAAVRARLGDLDGAEEAARRAIALSPAAGTAFQVLGLVRLERGDATGAVEPLERATRAAPEDGARWINLAVAYARAGRRVDACDALRKAAESGGGLAQEAQRRASAAGCPAP